MDLAFRYPVIVQVVTRNGRDLFYGCSPDFGIETFEIVDPGNTSQEIMFHLKIRRMIGESLSVHKSERKDPPPIRHASLLTYSVSSQDMGSCNPGSTQEMISTTEAAQMLGVHPDTVRGLFDSGTLKGSLTTGKQRLISVASVLEEQARMTNRVDMRLLELRAKKKNSKRRQYRVQKIRKEKTERFHANMAQFSKFSPET